mmetsp:Transcript_70404/g.198722  ORF Transcript_70404/g.198722 Transcript_70404/m.198722 type:complete len:218 (-) Transcript_70404:409-1062(-)
MVRTSSPPCLYMRKRIPSSEALSKTGVEDLILCRTTGSFPRYVLSWRELPVEVPCAISNEGTQEAGNSGPGLHITKASLRKWRLLSARTRRSSSTRWHRARTDATPVSGGTNRSPSSRRSERWGLNTSRKSLRSSSLITDASEDDLSTAAQKPPAEGPAQLPTLLELGPQGPSDIPRTGSDRSNLSMHRSTPRIEASVPRTCRSAWVAEIPRIGGGG